LLKDICIKNGEVEMKRLFKNLETNVVKTYEEWLEDEKKHCTWLAENNPDFEGMTVDEILDFSIERGNIMDSLVEVDKNGNKIVKGGGIIWKLLI